MASRVLVDAGGVRFYVELAEGAEVDTVGLRDVVSFDGVREAIEAIAEELSGALRRAQPTEATVEFGLSLTTKTGRLTGLLVEGGGEALLKVSLKWQSPAGRAD